MSKEESLCCDKCGSLKEYQPLYKIYECVQRECSAKYGRMRGLQMSRVVVTYNAVSDRYSLHLQRRILGIPFYKYITSWTELQPALDAAYKRNAKIKYRILQ